MVSSEFSPLLCVFVCLCVCVCSHGSVLTSLNLQHSHATAIHACVAQSPSKIRSRSSRHTLHPRCPPSIFFLGNRVARGHRCKARGIWRRLGRHGVSDEANLAKGPFAVRAATGIRCATVPHANPWTLSLVERDLERERERGRKREKRERERERERRKDAMERLTGPYIAAQPGLKSKKKQRSCMDQRSDS